MKAQESQFSSIVEKIYNLSLDDRLELKNLLEHNIAETRRNEIIDNFKTAQQEHKSGKLKFSSKITDLKKML